MQAGYITRQTNTPNPSFIEVVNLPTGNIYMTYGFYSPAYLGSEYTVAIFKIKYK